MREVRRIGWRLRLVGLISVVVATYVSLAYVAIPGLWFLLGSRTMIASERPQITTTRDGHPGDPINVCLVGDTAEVNQLLEAAGWYPADKLGVKTDLSIAVDTVLDREYNDAPVSRLYLFGRVEDLAFEIPDSTHPRHRHHVRLWKSHRTDDSGRTIWLGSASFDRSVGFSYTTGEFTHHIAARVDEERDYLAQSLRQTHLLTTESLEQGFHDRLQGFNGGGDRWVTDGALWKGIIKSLSRTQLTP